MHALFNAGQTLLQIHPTTSLATHLTAFWWQRTERRGLLAVALATGGVDPEAKTNAVGQGKDGVVRCAVLGGHTGTISPGNRVIRT